MIDPGELAFLQDLAKLLNKHGPAAFERLAAKLSDPRFVEDLRLILGVAAQEGRKTKAPPNPSPVFTPGEYRTVLAQLKQIEPEKAELLLHLHDRLMARRLLLTPKDLRAFAGSVGLPPLRSSGRLKLIVEFLEILRQCPLDRVQQILAQLPPEVPLDDRSLENWTRIILDRDLRARKAE